jgi:ATP-dependent Clp protease ATP-binding subunit ClpA
VLDELHRLLAQHPTGGYAALKRLLDASPVRMVGTSTPEGYRRFLQADPALKRRLRVVEVPPTTEPETLAILQARRAGLEARYGVRIETEVLALPVPGVNPAAALDRLEEACVRARSAGVAVTAAIVEKAR